MSIKKPLLLLLNIFLFNYCFAQDTLAKKNHLSDSVIEHFFVLKSNPETRQGPYTVLLRRKTLLVRGRYTNGVKAGVWQFYDVGGRLDEKYNYDKKTITYEGPLYGNADISFMFDDSLKMGDKLTRPLKVGGIYFGFLPYLNIFRVPFDMSDIDSYSFGAIVELLISPLGRLADYKVRLVSNYYDYDQVFSMDINQFSEEDRSFTPATHNGSQVMCRILIKCYVSPRGELDFY